MVAMTMPIQVNAHYETELRGLEEQTNHSINHDGRTRARPYVKCTDLVQHGRETQHHVPGHE